MTPWMTYGEMLGSLFVLKGHFSSSPSFFLNSFPLQYSDTSSLPASFLLALAAKSVAALLFRNSIASRSLQIFGKRVFGLPGQRAAVSGKSKQHS